MLMAMLHNENIVSAMEYDPEAHGNRLYCMDKTCKAPVIFVPGSENISPHFKTTGKGDSVHSTSCGFYEPLDLVGSIKKVKEYQDDKLQENMNEIVIRLSMNRIDPDREVATVEREKREKKPNELKVKNENLTPQTISSVKGVVKLLTEHEPDILSSILINVGGGHKVPLSQIIVNQDEAHKILWEDKMLKNVDYFVYGRVANIVKRETVMYVNFEETDVPFTLVVFKKHWKDFSYTEEKLKGKDVLVYGHLRKNDYNNKRLTEMIIKSDKYLEKIKRKEK